MKTLLLALGIKFKVTLWFKNNSTPFVMYVVSFSSTKKEGNFTNIGLEKFVEWMEKGEDYAFNIDEVIAVKSKRVWRPFI